MKINMKAPKSTTTSKSNRIFFIHCLLNSKSYKEFFNRIMSNEECLPAEALSQCEGGRKNEGRKVFA